MAASGQCIVIGAGVAGLSAARRFKELGVTPIVVDKGDGVGGRVATRRIGDAIVDHGAQYISARGPHMICATDEWRDRRIARPWHPLPPAPMVSEENVIGVNGINSIAKDMAKGLDVRTSWRVASLALHHDTVTVTSDRGESIDGIGAILTPPVPQSLEILRASQVALDATVQSQLEQIEYSRCIAVLATLPGESKIPAPGGMWIGTEPVQWIADNRKKGISPTTTAITILAGPVFSEAHWDSDSKTVAETVLHASEKWIGTEYSDMQVHFWKYARPIRKHPKQYLQIDAPVPLALAGDSFAGVEIEGAVLSGIAAATALADRLRT